MDLAKGLTQHTIVLCLDKQERAITLETILKKRNFRVVSAFGLYDALKYAEQEMPHLIICDALLQDGTVGTLYDRLGQNPTLKDTPIMVLVAKKTKEQLTPLTGRKFAGFLLGQYDSNGFLSKVQEILSINGDLSPYFVSFDDLSLTREVTLSAKATALGVMGEQVIYRADNEIDMKAAMVCVPGEKEKSPVLLSMGSTMVKGADVYNMFPLSRIRGKGRAWIEKLPTVDVNGNETPGVGRRRVVFFDNNPARSEQFKKILEGYNVDLIQVPTLTAAVAAIQRDGAQIGCSYFHELNAQQLAAVREAMLKMPENFRHPILVGTTSMSSRSTPDVRYIRKPFGLGVLVEMMESAFQSHSETAAALHTTSLANLDVDFQTPARILGLDETGGILEVKYPMAKGTKIKLNHPDLGEVWGNSAAVQITASSQPDPSVWLIRFESIGSENKTKYWGRVKVILDRFKAASPAA